MIGPVQYVGCRPDELDPAAVRRCEQVVRVHGHPDVRAAVVAADSACWAWNPISNLIIMPKRSLVPGEDAEFAAAIALHESQHSRWTRVHRFLDETERGGWRHELLNVCEDARIDSEAEQRHLSAGQVAAKWHQVVERAGVKIEQADPVGQFLLGLLHARATGFLPVIHADAEAAIRAVWPAFVRSIAHAPSSIADPDAAWQTHPAQLRLTGKPPVDAREKAALMLQWDALKIWLRDIEPAYLELIHKHGTKFLDSRRERARARRRAQRRAGVGDGAGAVPAEGTPEVYQAAVRRCQDRIRELQGILRRRLAARIVPTGTVGYQPSGRALDLDAVMAVRNRRPVPGCYVRRRTSPQPRANLTLLVDQSASMNFGERMQAAFDCVAIAAEAFRTIGRIRVFAFTTTAALVAERGGGAEVGRADARFEAKVAGLVGAGLGGTDLAASLRSLDRGPVDTGNDLVAVITDGDLTREDTESVRAWSAGRSTPSVVFVLDGGSSSDDSGPFRTVAPDSLPARWAEWLAGNTFSQSVRGARA